MARVKNGFLGNAAGKVGNVVFSKHKSTETVRSYQPIISNPKTAGQQIQRSLFSQVMQVLKNIPSEYTLIPGANINTKLSAINALSGFNIKNFKGALPFTFQSMCFIKDPYFFISISSQTYDPLFDSLHITISQNQSNAAFFNPLYFNLCGKLQGSDNVVPGLSNLCYMPDGFYCIIPTSETGVSTVYYNTFEFGFFWMSERGILYY
jgi:hypothetical protein